MGRKELESSPAFQELMKTAQLLQTESDRVVANLNGALPKLPGPSCKRQLSATEHDSVIDAERNALSHSVWRNKHGQTVTQCGKVVVSSTGFVWPGWNVTYTNDDGSGRNNASSSYCCQACRSGM